MKIEIIRERRYKNGQENIDEDVWDAFITFDGRVPSGGVHELFRNSGRTNHDDRSDERHESFDGPRDNLIAFAELLEKESKDVVEKVKKAMEKSGI